MAPVVPIVPARASQESLELPRLDDAVVHSFEPDVLSQDVHQGLMGVLDDAVVIAFHMQVDRRQLSRPAAVEAGEGDDVEALSRRPSGGADDVFRIP